MKTLTTECFGVDRRWLQSTFQQAYTRAETKTIKQSTVQGIRLIFSAKINKNISKLTRKNLLDERNNKTITSLSTFCKWRNQSRRKQRSACEYNANDFLYTIIYSHMVFIFVYIPIVVVVAWAFCISVRDLNYSITTSVACAFCSIFFSLYFYAVHGHPYTFKDMTAHTKKTYTSHIRSPSYCVCRSVLNA